MKLYCLLIMISSMVTTSKCDYHILMQFQSYNNPSGHCSTCRSSSSTSEPLGCCDQISEKGTCTGANRCDTYFRICLVPLGLPEQCVGDRFVVTGTNVDDRAINFNLATFLEVGNPLRLNGISRYWDGAQLLIRAHDSDAHSSEDPLVDIFVKRLSAPSYQVGQNFQKLLIGRENIAQLGFTFRVVCSENFRGPSCGEMIQSQSCSMFGGLECAGNGVCVNSVCECNSGYNGDSCQLNIDDCGAVNCSGQGSCLDGTNNYTCICESGFSGQNCEVKLMQDVCANVECTEGTHCEARTVDEQSPSAECVCNSNVSMCNTEPPTTTIPTDPDNPVLDPLIPLIAGIGGGLLLVSVCIVILLITICAVLRKRASPQTIGRSVGKMSPTPDTIFKGKNERNISAVSMPLPSTPFSTMLSVGEDSNDEGEYVYQYIYDVVSDDTKQNNLHTI